MYYDMVSPYKIYGMAGKGIIGMCSSLWPWGGGGVRGGVCPRGCGVIGLWAEKFVKLVSVEFRHGLFRKGWIRKREVTAD
jgi:hypothetical protein